MDPPVAGAGVEGGRLATILVTAAEALRTLAVGTTLLLTGGATAALAAAGLR